MLLPTRLRDRVVADRAGAYPVLDEALICHVGVVVDGRPHVLPTLHARVDDILYVHGSTAARILAAARPGPLPVCVTVSLLDGLVLARSAFHHSLNYRSVVIHGAAALVTDAEEKGRALAALVDRVGIDRSAQCRPPSAKELAATAVLAVDLAAEGTDVALKARTGGPVDDEADLALDHWAGVVPVRLTAGIPEPDLGSARIGEVRGPSRAGEADPGGSPGERPTPAGLAPSLR
ncbi:pyridoxamine 5'-phosphate oxidase family protein [Frankia sp. CNm7]|uniref:Pyridoxamine 5'-phosphate oxidase family protein n=1 Tax=Frankia nepalensis TaxID=1836974 RepID=A0A937UT73_9ACTN|nr:pyridoxamine 5'-phosphate oxidase family protein [Frankia nepalensis]MBL7499982.1 pyridoxamine 5'-phosphate oxidase family protein [Frankia nepalensis]MBL7512515.1 pyridoxamine 5'-phosphate oxidase family protein [Frankia nepalensis]MBL7517432.1 pyridoxamine 5'-phosphate oxidase family protein [Frankia nepalensis]MBL7632818.1 pyridoxamine 5'-phosphate oxidase family protein [Frankia nepalensis]